MSPSFSPERLEQLAQLEGWHSWFIGRRELIRRLLHDRLGGEGRLVLDVGCGTGLMVSLVGREPHRAVGLDLRREGLVAASRRATGSDFVQAEATRLPLADATFSLVMLLDVLEHVDDQAALMEVNRVLCPGGLLLVSVPAMQWLWSYRDEAAGHLRRYSKFQLASLLSQAQLPPTRMVYYHFLLFPMLALTRLFGRRSPRARDFEERRLPVVTTLMTWMNLLEVRLGSRVSYPWGSSLVAICQKN